MCPWLLPQPLGILKVLCLEIYWSYFAPCHSQVRLRKLKFENAGHLFNTFFSSPSVSCFICLHACSRWATVGTDLWTLKEHNVFTYLIIFSHTVLIIFFRIFPPLYYSGLIAVSRKVFYSRGPETWPSSQFFSQG